MSSRELMAGMKPLVDALLPPKVVKQVAAVEGAISEDSSIRNDALYPNLPWQRADVHIPGEVETGIVARIPLPQGGDIRHVAISALTAPTTALQLQVETGTESGSFSLQAGETVKAAPASLHATPGSWAMVSITETGGAEDVTIVLHYTPAAFGSNSSGGGSGGGDGGGAVSSVNGKTGTVVLNADDINDTATSHKFVTASDLTKLSNLSGVNTGDQDLSGYALSSSLSLVATSGNYNDLSNRPSLGTAAAMNASSFATAAQGGRADSAVQPGDLPSVAVTGDYNDLDNTPDIPAQFNPIAGTNMSITGTYPDITFTSSGGGGGGAVDSVNGKTGAVVLDADDIDDTSTAHRFATAAQLTKLNGIAAGATANATNAQLRDRSTHTGTQAASTITGLANVATSGQYSDLSGAPNIAAMIAEWAPKADSNSATQTLTANAFGIYAFTNAAISITGLPVGSMWRAVSTVHARAIGTGSGGQGNATIQITSNGTTATTSHPEVPIGTSGQMFLTLTYASDRIVGSNGTITMTPAVRNISGTFVSGWGAGTLQLIRVS